jgi:hypothetical protein
VFAEELWQVRGKFFFKNPAESGSYASETCQKPSKMRRFSPPNPVCSGGVPVPRTSSAALSVAPVAIGPARLSPPADLPELERQKFAELVATQKPDHFRPEDVSLLCAYVRAGLTEKLAADEVAAGNLQWQEALAGAQRALVALSVRLRIGPRSRGSNISRAARPRPAPSFYESMQLEGDDAAG